MRQSKKLWAAGLQQLLAAMSGSGSPDGAPQTSVNLGHDKVPGESCGKDGLGGRRLDRLGERLRCSAAFTGPENPVEVLSDRPGLWSQPPAAARKSCLERWPGPPPKGLPQPKPCFRADYRHSGPIALKYVKRGYHVLCSHGLTLLLMPLAAMGLVRAAVEGYKAEAAGLCRTGRTCVVLL